MIMSYKKGITIAGTHGKTSTTAITSLMLECGKLDPTIINGGIINYFHSNSKLGEGDFLIAESDESDGSFVDLPTFIGVVTNIEPEHLESYNHDFEEQKKFFIKYISQIPQNGLCALCIDDLEVENIYNNLKDSCKNLITYSIKKDADIVAYNIVSDQKGITFDVEFRQTNKHLKSLYLPARGIHNVANSLAAIAIANFLQISDDDIKQALFNFSGVKRRFTEVGNVNGITIIDDYGHHPTEIIATIKAARQLAKDHKVIAVIEPHKYTRVHDLFNEFCGCATKADIVIICNIYSAGQSPIEGVTQDNLVAGIKKTGHPNVIKLSDEKDLALLIKNNATKGDVVLCLGAGNITYLANKLPEQLKNLN